MKGGIPKKVPTEKWMRRFVESRGGVYGGQFSHPVGDGESARYDDMRAGRGYLRTVAIWHRKTCFVYFMPCAFSEGQPIQMPSYEGSYKATSKAPGLNDRLASKGAAANV